MSREDVEKALERAGLAVPAREIAEIAAMAHVIETISAAVRGRRPLAAEPAHVFAVPGPEA
jgi:hypothetical protein